MEISLIKHSGILVPATDQDAEKLARVKSGRLLSVEMKEKRNSAFHRKFFSMLNVGFDAFEPPEAEHRGMPAQKSFERFRKDVIIAAGYYDVVSTITGEVRAEAHSISFAKMTQEEFEKLYSNCCNVLLQRVLRNYTRSDLDDVVEKLIRY